MQVSTLNFGFLFYKVSLNYKKGKANLKNAQLQPTIVYPWVYIKVLLKI